MEKETIEWSDVKEYQADGWSIIGIDYSGTIEERILKPIMGKE